MNGSFQLYLWGGKPGADFVVEESGTSTSYRSGEWWENLTGDQADPRGVSRDQYEQLLRVTVHDGNLTIRLETGIARLAGDEFRLSSFGGVTFAGGTGRLESAQTVYSAQAADFQIQGLVELLGLRRADEEGRLRADVRAEAAEITLPGQAKPTEPPLVGDEEAPDPEMQVGDPVAKQPKVYVLGSLVFLLLLGAVLAYNRRVPPEDLLSRAEVALALHKPAKARRFASRAIRRRGDDLDAWFLLGASLLAMEKYDEVSRRVGSFAQHLPPSDSGGLAFVLALAEMNQGRNDQALAWLRKSAHVPELLEQARREPVFAPIIGALTPPQAPDPSYQ